MKKTTSGFTIVELLIVIVVIAILAAISIVAYNGIQERARVSEVSSALSQAKKKIGVWQVDNPETTPSDLATAGVTSSGNVSYQYKPGTNGTYCITATSGPTSYKITNDTAPTSGGCAGHGVGGQAAITNLAVNPSVEVNAANWTSGYQVQTPSLVSETIFGSNALLHVPTVDGISYIYVSGMPVTAGEAYTASITGKVRSGSSRNLFIQIVWRSSTGSGLGEISSGVSVLNTGQTNRFSVSGIAPTNATTAQIQLRNNSSLVADRYAWDGAMFTRGSTQYPYADPNINLGQWDWNGTPNNSTSTGPAPIN